MRKYPTRLLMATCCLAPAAIPLETVVACRPAPPASARPAPIALTIIAADGGFAIGPRTASNARTADGMKRIGADIRIDAILLGDHDHVAR